MEGGNGNEGFMSKVRNQSIAFGASVQEGWEYIKASITGHICRDNFKICADQVCTNLDVKIYMRSPFKQLVKKVQAKNEKEATEADMQTSKAQVEATDAAEAKKQQLSM